MKNSKELKYEQVTLENIEIAFQIQKEIWPDDPDYNDFLDKANHSKDDNVSWLVYYEHHPIGITGVYVEDIDNETIWLDWYGILPKYRQKGLGKKILIDTIEYCKNLNKYQYFRLDTTYYENRPALFLYDKIMDLKEEYTVEDTEKKKNNFLIYTYVLNGKLKPWNNRYLGLRAYYDNCQE